MKKTKEQVHNNMSVVRNNNTDIESKLCDELISRGIRSFVKNVKDLPGKPDIVFFAWKIAVFCDGDFWHGYNWNIKKKEIKTNKSFWYDKIEKNIVHDECVTDELVNMGWRVMRFWGTEIKKNVKGCADKIESEIRKNVSIPYKTIDLCAGIGGIRRGFELTGKFKNVMSAEIDKYACQTYEHLFGENPLNDLTDESFKKKLDNLEYDILLAGFPCQTFSRVGLEEGFENHEKGQIFFHIADIIKRTRPAGFFLENVDHLVTHNKGNTFKIIVETLVLKLNYHIVGVSIDDDGNPIYVPKSFIRNSKNFGVPQNRPRTYIIGFDKDRFSSEKIAMLPEELPLNGKRLLYKNLNDLLEKNVQPKYYMSSGYFETLVKHREREEKKGNGFGYRVVNAKEIENPIANTLLATGGSGKERNLIYDPQEGIAGMVLKTKRSPLNDKGIRVMNPTEWGKLQGFVNYAFLDQNGKDLFSFPQNIADGQKYKQFGNSVTIPVIETMAEFMAKCFDILCN